MKRSTLKCEICGREISKSNYVKHINSCKGLIIRYVVDHEGLECKFCGKLCKNRRSLISHEILCKENPDRDTPGFLKAVNKG